MLTTRLTRITALLLIVEAVLITVPAAILQAIFNFPAILTQPASTVLPLFYSKSTIIIPTYYAFMLSGVLLIILAVLLHRILAPRPSVFMNMTTTIGVVAGIFQILGFIRWPFVVSYLAASYVSPQTSDVTRQAISVFYQAFNVYMGHTVGEHLGFLFNATWGVLVAIAILRSPLFTSWRWIGWIGIPLSLGILGNPLQDLSLNFVSTSTYYFSTNLTALNLIYLISYGAWTVWLVTPALRLLFVRSTTLKKMDVMQAI